MRFRSGVLMIVETVGKSSRGQLGAHGGFFRTLSTCSREQEIRSPKISLPPVVSSRLILSAHQKGIGPEVEPPSETPTGSEKLTRARLRIHLRNRDREGAGWIISRTRSSTRRPCCRYPCTEPPVDTDTAGVSSPRRPRDWNRICILSR